MSTRTIYGIAIGFVAIAVGLWATYQYDKDRLGPELAKTLLFKHFASYFTFAALLVMTGASMELDNVVTILFPVLIILVIAVQVFRVTRNPVKDQEAVFDLTRANQYRNGEAIIFGMLGGIAFIGAIVFLFRDGVVESRFFAMGGLCLAFSAYFAIYNRQAHTVITRDGVAKGSESVPWNQFKRHHWGDNRDDTVLLVLEREGSFSALRHLEVKVPADRREDIEKVLRGVMSGR